MSRGGLPDEQVITLALEAISDGDGERLRPLLDPRVRVITDRAVHEGIEDVVAWAKKRYQHLDRRYALEELAPAGAGIVGTGRVEYVWRDSGQVGDANPIYFGIELAGGLLSRLSLHDRASEALESFGV